MMLLVAGKGHAFVTSLRDGEWRGRDWLATAAGISATSADETLRALAGFRLVGKRRIERKVEWRLTKRGLAAATLLDAGEALVQPGGGFAAAIAGVPELEARDDFHCVALFASAATADLAQELAVEARRRGASAAFMAHVTAVTDQPGP
jgi:hypothetical protein